GWTRTRRLRLHLDVRRYFPSVHHGVLLAILNRRVRDSRTRSLLERLVRSGRDVYAHPLAQRVIGPPEDAERGLPIGSSFSQWAANLYLDGLDHFVKETLRVKAYLRYVVMRSVHLRQSVGFA
ncbi:MAG: RNA-directed DNA polymerase, partial [Myxococcota bacterium]